MRYDDSDYDRYDAMADAAADAWEGMVQEVLRPRVDAEMLEVELTDEDEPHPWTWHRHLAGIWEEDGEDAVREIVEEDLREEAEEEARDIAEHNTPCCRSRYCPCGGY
jgi:hypothetical protein